MKWFLGIILLVVAFFFNEWVHQLLRAFFKVQGPDHLTSYLAFLTPLFLGVGLILAANRSRFCILPIRLGIICLIMLVIWLLVGANGARDL